MIKLISEVFGIAANVNDEVFRSMAKNTEIVEMSSLASEYLTGLSVGDRRKLRGKKAVIWEMLDSTQRNNVEILVWKNKAYIKNDGVKFI